MEHPRSLEALGSHRAPGQGLRPEELEPRLVHVEVVILPGDVDQLPDLAHRPIAGSQGNADGRIRGMVEGGELQPPGGVSQPTG